MLKEANTDLFNPLLPNHNSECHNLSFPLQIKKPLKKPALKNTNKRLRLLPLNYIEPVTY